MSGGQHSIQMELEIAVFVLEVVAESVHVSSWWTSEMYGGFTVATTDRHTSAIS
jgi:hypothetical protein